MDPETDDERQPGAGRGGSSKQPAMSKLVGAGPSRVGVGGAMRARDVSRIRPEDLAEAEREVVIKHATTRPDPRPGGRRRDAPLPGPPAPRPAASRAPVAGRQHDDH